MTGLRTPTGRELGAWPSGSPEWHAARRNRLGGSSVAAVLGLSKWQSPYGLWCEMAELVGTEPQTAAQARGHYLEAGVAAWFADRHPEWGVHKAGTYVHKERGWQLANPDRLICEAPPPTAAEDVDVRAVASALLEIKTDADGRDWGRPGTDEIPLYYMTQVQWYMDVLGLPVTYVAVLTGRLEFREYVVDYDPAAAAEMRLRGEAFIASLLLEEAPPLDTRKATYETLRRRHPMIDRERKHLVDTSLGVEVIDALQELETAQDRVTSAKSKLLAAMGTAYRAYFNGELLATRTAKGVNGVPYLKFEPNLPDVTDLVGAYL
ncbi:YqaJ viral recombinase family nuclease [Streptosporangium saharense]|nr:YqaJ viral recombinase family protein [Streptosporangium saharense]